MGSRWLKGSEVWVHERHRIISNFIFRDQVNNIHYEPTHVMSPLGHNYFMDVYRSLRGADPGFI